MLLELRVENLLLIERAELRFAPGLNAITGETGAGKTVLAHALDLLLGGKPRPGIVRPGAGEAYVEGAFELPEGLFDGEALEDLRERLPAQAGEIVLGRRVAAEGRTRAFVQGRSASAADLRELGQRLIAFYGQHEHRRLTVGSAQLEALDAFCGEEHRARARNLAAGHRRVLDLGRELDALRARAGTRDRDRDLLAFELEEIEALAPSPEERAQLTAERDRLRAIDDLRASAGAAAEALAPEADAPGAVALLSEAERHAEPGAGADPELAALVERLRSLRIEAEDVGAEARAYLAGLAAEPGRLEEVEERLALYERLERKHGGSLDAVLAHARRCADDLQGLEGFETQVAAAEAELARANGEEDHLAAAVTAERRKAAPRLAKKVTAELRGLAMDGAEFGVLLEPRAQRASSGDEAAEFTLAPNPGVPPSALRDTASGGELSRTMLALMGVASDAGAETVVFDEVDAGIGGQTARAVGERLRGLAARRQVLCITHLPQIASLAERHFRIEKRSSRELADARVDRLEEGEVVAELCRMLGADAADDGARRHAEDLLAAA